MCPSAIRASTIMNLYVPPQSDWGALMNVSGGGGGLFLSFTSPPPPPAVKNELSLWYLMFQLCPNFWNTRRPLRSSSPGSCSHTKYLSYAEPWLHSLRRHSSHIRPLVGEDVRFHGNPTLSWWTDLGVEIKTRTNSIISAARPAPLLPHINAVRIPFFLPPPSFFLPHKTRSQIQTWPEKQAERWMIPKAFGNRFNVDRMDCGAATPVITAEPTRGKAHLTKQQPGELYSAQIEHVYKNRRRGGKKKKSAFICLFSLMRLARLCNADVRCRRTRKGQRGEAAASRWQFTVSPKDESSWMKALFGIWWNLSFFSPSLV